MSNVSLRLLSTPFLLVFVVIISISAGMIIANGGREFDEVSVKQAQLAQFRDLDGVTRNISHLEGAYRIVNFWATWCPPCREEMPALDRLEAELGGTGFSVLPLCIDAEGIDRGRRFYDEIGIVNLPLYWAEPVRVQLALAFIGLPTTLLIDRQGREIGRRQGPVAWDGKAATGQLRSLL